MKIQYKYGIMWLFELSIAILVSFSYGHYIVNLVSDSHKAVEHTQTVLNYVDQLRVKILNAETGQRGYIITNDLEYLKPYKRSIETIDDSINRLEKITLEDPVQHNRVLSLKKNIYLKLEELNQVIDIREKSGFEEASQKVSQDVGMYLMIECQNTLDAIFKTEYDALQERQLNESISLKIMKYTIPLAVFINFLILILVYYMIREQETIEIKKIINLSLKQKDV